MPEGDTVHKVAAVVRQELAGRLLTGCLLRGVPGSERLAGARVLEVEALGKHLLIHLDREVMIRVHLGMRGSWHRYPAGAPWKRSRQAAGVVLETEDTVLVCFRPMQIEAIPVPRRRWHRQLENLGSDLLAEAEPDWQAALVRCGKLHPPEDPLGEILLDQRILAGIGNVYKSELAYMGPLQDNPFALADRAYSPWMPWSAVPAADLLAIWRRARHLLQANLGGWFRTTRVDRRKQAQSSEGNLFVYGRQGQPCLRCGGAIVAGYQGLQNRVTYWCPACQPEPTPPAAPRAPG